MYATYACPSSASACFEHCPWTLFAFAIVHPTSIRARRQSLHEKPYSMWHRHVLTIVRSVFTPTHTHGGHATLGAHAKRQTRIGRAFAQIRNFPLGRGTGRYGRIHRHGSSGCRHTHAKHVILMDTQMTSVLCVCAHWSERMVMSRRCTGIKSVFV